MNKYPSLLPGLAGALGFTELPAPEYVRGLVDLSEICNSARRRRYCGRIFGRPTYDRILIHDFDPPEFWQMVESAGCIETASDEIGPENVIIYLNWSEKLGSDHPIAKIAEAGSATVRRLMIDLQYGFRVLDRHGSSDSIVTLMKPNPDDERFPLIIRLGYEMVGAALSQIHTDLTGGYMDYTEWHE